MKVRCAEISALTRSWLLTWGTQIEKTVLEWYILVGVYILDDVRNEHFLQRGSLLRRAT